VIDTFSVSFTRITFLWKLPFKIGFLFKIASPFNVRGFLMIIVLCKERSSFTSMVEKGGAESIAF